MIEGVVIQELKRVVDEKGDILHMLRADSPLFSSFGEVYFSCINPKVVKAWKKHLRMTQHIAVPVGKVELVMFDDREDSQTQGMVDVVEIGFDHYCLVKIPTNIWYGFRNISVQASLIANCTDLPHDPHEMIRKDTFTATIPHIWKP